MRQQVRELKDRVVMTINPHPTSPVDGSFTPTVRKDGTLLHFAIKPIQDHVTPRYATMAELADASRNVHMRYTCAKCGGVCQCRCMGPRTDANIFECPECTPGVKYPNMHGEDTIKGPTNKHIRDQSPFRSSFGKARSFGSISKPSYTESKTMLGKIDPFGDRLGQSLNEHVEITFAEPDVLLTHAQRPLDENPVDKQELIKNAITLESKRFESYIEMINATEDEEVLTVLESLSEESSENIKKLEAMLTRAPAGSAPSSNQVKD
jgi:predicted RNA-binding Zn-ribbon protein involved in translation (DUF1610 family)